MVSDDDVQLEDETCSAESPGDSTPIIPVLAA